jgi:oligoribonuclease (3'-5' exoribonuclease)
MSEWCIETHTATGLVDACQSSSAISASQAAAELLTYIKRYINEPRVALLAGNSVHADKMFLMKDPWSPVLEWLHYRILDVSAMKEAVRRWGSESVLEGVPSKKLCHSADEDVRESLEEARYYMGLIQRLGGPSDGSG